MERPDLKSIENINSATRAIVQELMIGPGNPLSDAIKELLAWIQHLEGQEKRREGHIRQMHMAQVLYAQERDAARAELLNAHRRFETLCDRLVQSMKVDGEVYSAPVQAVHVACARLEELENRLYGPLGRGKGRPDRIEVLEKRVRELEAELGKKSSDDTDG